MTPIANTSLRARNAIYEMVTVDETNAWTGYTGGIYECNRLVHASEYTDLSITTWARHRVFKMSKFMLSLLRAG